MWPCADARSPRRRPTALLVTALLTLGVLSGCGGGADTDPIETIGPTGGGATAASGSAAVKIESPREGERIALAGGVAVLWASGRGEAGRELDVGADQCGPNCREQTRVDEEGRWRVRLVLPAKAGQSLTIRATYPDDDASAASVKVKTSGRALASGGETSRRKLVMIGDSLAVGTEAALRSLLDGWSVEVDGRIGRSLAAGLGLIAAQDFSNSASSVLAVSLFTNDPPGNVAALRSGVTSTLGRIGADGCLLWGTVVAPPIGGVSYAAANQELRKLAGEHENLRLVAWDRLAAREPSLLEPDDVHPTAEGYRQLARLYARAARGCG